MSSFLLPFVLQNCLTFFWMDGYDPNGSTKGNQNGAWAGSLTFVLVDLRDVTAYYIDSHLFATGQGKGGQKEDHTCILQEMVKD
jgi:hypothetical protein